jgi:hypothetical protein
MNMESIRDIDHNEIEKRKETIGRMWESLLVSGLRISAGTLNGSSVKTGRSSLK